MSTHDPKRKEEEQLVPPQPPIDEKEAKKPEPAKPGGLSYVFKIAPADPKRNTIDFEDVADK